MSALPCLVLPCLDVSIKDCIFEFTSTSLCSSFLPAVCTVTEDQTLKVGGAPSHRFVLFVFFGKFLFCSCVCLSRGKEVATRPSALARVKSAWEFGGIASSAASPLAASPHARRSREISAAGCGYPKPAGWLPSSRVAAPPRPPFAGDQACRIATDSSPVDPVHNTARSAVCMSCCAHRNILITLSCLVHGDSSRAGGSSSHGRGGHSQPPAPLSRKWRRLLRDPVRATSTTCHGLLSSQLRHGLLSSLHRHGFQSSQLRHGPCLSVLLWRSPSCVPVCVCPEGLPDRPPPLPGGTVKAQDEPFRRGELCQSSVVCVMCSRLLCPYLVCFLSLFNVIMT